MFVLVRCRARAVSCGVVRCRAVSCVDSEVPNRRTRILIVCVHKLQGASDKNLLKLVDCSADLTHLVRVAADSHFTWVTTLGFRELVTLRTIHAR
jgi:hypothetical protein